MKIKVNLKIAGSVAVSSLLLLFLFLMPQGMAVKNKSQDNTRLEVVSHSPVKLGIDNIDKHIAIFQGKRVGLITNPTGINSNYQPTIDVLKDKVNLVALFSPEHGIRGNIEAGAQIGSNIDRKTGLPVFSLYGPTKKPTAEMLDNVDILAFDMQDIGARFYTYIYTMAYAMQSCKELGKRFVVFDRPNPIGGEVVEGGILNPEYASFIGLYPIPIRHGMTVGEIAKFFNKEFDIGCDLTVIEMTGWKRNMYYDDTRLPWIMPSPNIPTVDTALLYSGTGIFGGTNISEGVGTTRPFELIGAPWLDADYLANVMNNQGLKGVVFRPVYFNPAFGKYKGQTCAGVQIHIADRKQFSPVKTGIILLYTIKEMSGAKFRFNAAKAAGANPMIDLYIGDSYLREERFSKDEIVKKWEDEAGKFKLKAVNYYIY